jgi:hypothetical protein
MLGYFMKLGAAPGLAIVSAILFMTRYWRKAPSKSRVSIGVNGQRAVIVTRDEKARGQH